MSFDPKSFGEALMIIFILYILLFYFITRVTDTHMHAYVSCLGAKNGVEIDYNVGSSFYNAFIYWTYKLIGNCVASMLIPTLFIILLYILTLRAWIDEMTSSDKFVLFAAVLLIGVVNRNLLFGTMNQLMGNTLLLMALLIYKKMHDWKIFLVSPAMFYFHPFSAGLLSAIGVLFGDKRSKLISIISIIVILYLSMMSHHSVGGVIGKLSNLSDIKDFIVKEYIVSSIFSRVWLYLIVFIPIITSVIQTSKVSIDELKIPIALIIISIIFPQRIGDFFNVSERTISLATVIGLSSIWDIIKKEEKLYLILGLFMVIFLFKYAIMHPNGSPFDKNNVLETIRYMPKDSYSFGTGSGGIYRTEVMDMAISKNITPVFGYCGRDHPIHLNGCLFSNLVDIRINKLNETVEGISEDYLQLETINKYGKGEYIYIGKMPPFGDNISASCTSIGEYVKVYVCNITHLNS